MSVKLRVLVTGGAGFLGSHVCEALLRQKAYTICLDDFSTGSPDNIAALRDNADFETVRHDVRAPFDAEVDAIFNLACPASPRHYQADPIRTFTTSILGAINMLDLARHRKAAIVQSSTSEIYGDPLEHPQAETYWGNVNPIGVRACYDEGKRGAETLFADYRRIHGVSTRIARIFNTYGPRMRANDGRVVSNFIVQALTGRDLTIYGDGSQTRSFCYVDDLVAGLIELMRADTAGPVNLGNPAEYPIRELAETVIELVGSRSRIVHRPGLPDDPRRRRPDISAAASLLGWRPVTPLRSGLQRTIAYFDAVLSRAGSPDEDSPAGPVPAVPAAGPDSPPAPGSPAARPRWKTV